MPRKLLYLVAEDWFFCSHFLNRARAARDAGFDVVVATNVNRHGAAIEGEGFRLVPLGLARGGVNPLGELRTLLRIRGIYRRERPDLVHQVALKPVLYGSLATRTLRGIRVINAPVGMGYVFTSTDAKARLLKPLVQALLRFTLHVPGGLVVFENPDDLRSHVAAGAVEKEQAVLIRGAGVDVRHFHPVQRRDGEVVITLLARMLYDKGVVEFAEAARRLKAQGLLVRCRLVGGLDEANPSCVPRPVLDAWVREGILEWLGHQSEVQAVWQSTDIACLPSYREGLPKSSLEALACGLPLVTTDVPGCRETVVDGDNGLLVPARDATALAEALARLVRDAPLRRAMGKRGRDRAVREFSDEIVIAQTLQLYGEP